jgi:hypothetical protein
LQVQVINEFGYRDIDAGEKMDDLRYSDIDPGEGIKNFKNL